MQAEFSTRQRYFFYGLIILLLIPALLINLGVIAYIDDEARRALVALEMELSGNYLAPTVNGEFYYRKPPLYNWFLIIWFRIFGAYEEFVSRAATVFCLLGYAATIFVVSARHFSRKFAFLNALFLITCGRILIYDSMLGLIDIAYSWVTFVAFVLVYQQYEKRNFKTLFMLTYALTAVGFLLKGLPSLVFQAGTLGAFFIWKKDFKRLFAPAHFLGIGVFVAITGAYYFAYSQVNGLEHVFTTLFTESSNRTATVYGIEKTLLHLFTFPFEIIGHFLPWTILFVLFFQKNIRGKLSENSFIAFCVLTFLVNILVYWVSVEVYPRYLFMHLPLLFTVLLYMWFYHRKDAIIPCKIVFGVLAVLNVLISVAVLLPLFLEGLPEIEHLALKSGVLFVAASALTVLFFLKKEERLLITVAVLLVGRIGFNWFVIPDRYANDWGTQVKLSSEAFGKTHQKESIFYYAKTPIQVTNSFYITKEAQQIFRKKENADNPNDIFLVDAQKNKDIVFDTLPTPVKLRYLKLELTAAKNIRKQAVLD